MRARMMRKPSSAASWGMWRSRPPRLGCWMCMGMAVGSRRRIRSSRLRSRTRVRAQARRLGVSAATLFHAAWALVVARTSGRDDVVFGTVLLGRLQGSAGAQRILGMFINTLPLRLPLQQMTAKELVERTQRELVELLSHEQSSLALAQRCSGVAGSTPLFSTLLNYRHSAPSPEGGRSDASGIQVLAAQERTNYPIAVSVDDLGEGFAVTAQTDRRIDPQRMVRYVCTAVQSLVRGFGGGPADARAVAVDPPGTWEALPCLPAYYPGRGDRVTNPRPAVGRPGPPGAKRQARRRVLSGEGNRVRREGPRESHTAVVPWKPGNSPRRTRWRKGCCRRAEPAGGTRRSTLWLHPLSP